MKPAVRFRPSAGGGAVGIGIALIAFGAGVAASHALPMLHPLWWCALLGGALLLPAPRLRLPAMLALGLGWGAWNIVEARGARIDPACAEAVLSGRVRGLPAEAVRSGAAGEAGGMRGMRVQRFAFEPDAPAAPSACTAGLLRLSWFDGPQVRGGERWRLRVRLRAPRGLANRHGFDGARHLARAGFAATGYVLEGERLAAQPGAAGLADRLREALRERLGRLALANDGVIRALTLGDASAIADAERDLYRRTGTLHLLVISGLHVGVVTACGFLLGRGIGRLAGRGGRTIGAALGLSLGLGYVLLAGAGLSLLRAFSMAAAGVAALLLGRSAAPLVLFGYALAAVLLIDPMAPLAPGFWLSFGAVATLLGYFWPRPAARSGLRSAVAAQCAIVCAFAPATVGITGLLHPLSLAANLLAVPLVTVLVVPLALLGTALLGTAAGELALRCADFGVTLVAVVLGWADRVAPVFVPAPGARLAWLIALSAALLAPLSRLAAAAVAAALALLLFWPLARPPPGAAPGDAEVAMLDVGQGTAVLVRTASRTLVYDTGPGYFSGGDSGARVVLPALRGRGIRRIDLLVLSHGDADHVGGAASLLAGITVAAVHAGEPAPGIAAERCAAGMRWQWDGVQFAYLHPPRHAARTGNDASCVLLIETRRARVLLAGDIERGVERNLDAPRVDLLLVPHHGSATSSTGPFVARARPRFAVVAAGWGNPFGHPHPDVVARYRAVGAHLLSTAVVGAVYWNSAAPQRIRTARCRASPYWQRNAPDGRGQALAIDVPAC